MNAQAIAKPKFYILGMRLPFCTASVFPAITGVIWGWIYGRSFSFIHAAIAVVGVAFLHLGANTINDYFDWDESDKINRYPTPFSGGSRKLLEGILSRDTFLTMSITFFAIALICGLLLVFLNRPYVLLIGTAGALCGILYSVKPFSFQSRGLGEIIIFLAFGPLITYGAGYAACSYFSPEFLLIGIPNGFAVVAILWINEFPDIEADKTSGKRNLVVRLGTSRSRWGYIILMAGFFISTWLLCLYKIYPIWTALTIVLTIPAIKNTTILWKNHSNPSSLISSQRGTIVFQTLTSILIICSIIVNGFI